MIKLTKRQDFLSNDFFHASNAVEEILTIFLTIIFNDFLNALNGLEERFKRFFKRFKCIGTEFCFSNASNDFPNRFSGYWTVNKINALDRLMEKR